MKKLCSMAIILFAFSLTAACGNLKSSNQETVCFYYCKQSVSYNEADDVISAENRYQKEIGNELQDIITKYLSGPQSSSLTALFPYDTTLTEMEQSETSIRIILSKECAQMNELDFVLACSCLAKTLFPITQTDQILIGAEEGYTEPLTFHADSFLTDADIQTIG